MSAISHRFLCAEKDKAASSKTYVSRITPIGSNGATAGETVRIKLPSMRVGTYFDPKQSFLSFDFQLSRPVQNLPQCGIASIFKTVIVRCAGQHISTIDQAQLQRNMLYTRHVKEDFLANDGSVMFLTSTKTAGQALLASTKYSVVDFMSMLSPFFDQNCMISLASNSPIEIDIILGETTYGFEYDQDLAASNHAGDGASGLVLSNIALNLSVCEMTPEVDRQIMAHHGGVFKFLSQNVHYAPFSVATGSTAVVLNLPLSVSSLNRVDIALTAQSTPRTLALSKFLKYGLTKAELIVDGVQIYPHGITGENALTLAHARRSNHELDDFEVYSNAKTASYETGEFILSFDTEHVHKSNFRAGLNVASSTCQLNLTFASALAQNINCHVYSYHDALVYLNMNGTRDFEVNI